MLRVPLVRLLPRLCHSPLGCVATNMCQSEEGPGTPGKVRQAGGWGIEPLARRSSSTVILVVVVVLVLSAVMGKEGQHVEACYYVC